MPFQDNIDPADLHRVRKALEALRDHARDVRGHDTTAADITRILNGETDRVRKELEALRDHARDARGHDTTADDITRILNGETNE